MVSEKFRYQLRREAQKWHDEAIIDREIHNILVDRYGLDRLDANAQDRFVSIVLGVGFVLLGLGVITFVAANWQALSRSLRVILLLSLFVATNWGGFYLWRSPQSKQARFGRGLLILGALSLGANIGLMSQMFHQTGSVYTLYLIWGLAVWAMAFGLRLTSLGLMAIILVAIGYYLSLITGVLKRETFDPLVTQMPFIIAFLFIPLAYSTRSQWIFFLSAIVLGSALAIDLSHYIEIADLTNQSVYFAWLYLLIPSLFWSYRDRLLFSDSTVKFDRLTQKLTVAYFAIFFYILSFDVWGGNLNSSQSGKLIDLTPFSLLIAPIIFTVFALWGWWRLGISNNQNTPWRADRDSIYVGSSLLCVAFLIWFNSAIASIGFAGTIFFNFLLSFLAIFLIRKSVREGRRFNFWLGIILLVLQIFTRMFEYDTALILKAIALVGCGITAILAGLWFEKNLTTVNSATNLDN